MSQSGSGDHHNGTVQTENGDTQHHQSNGPSQNGIKAESKADLSNGFENRTVDYERSVPNVVSVQQVPSMAPDYPSVSQPGVYPTPGRLAQPLPEDRQQQQYQDKSGLEHHVSQTATQTLPVQIQPHFVPDFVSDQSQSQYPQARGQFEVRSQMYNQQGQYGDRVGYVTRDVTYRDSSLYAHAQGTGNPVFTGANAGYVTVQHASQLQHASQSASPQPGFYPGVIMTAQPSVSQSYGQFAGQSQYTYGQYPQTLINPIPYNPHAPMYTAQQFNQQTSPNPQRYSQEVSQYQGQPIIQPISQNVIAPVDRSVNSSTTRGPKPMVPPRINSKISSDSGNRKSITEIPVAKPVSTTVTVNSNANAGAVSVAAINASTVTGIVPANAGVNQSAPPISQESATPISVSDSRSFPAPVNQTPRTRQDGLYIDSSADQSTRDTIVDTIPNECLYVSRNEHRKSVSDVTTASFPRRNDTITFTFPGDTGDTSLLTARKPPSGLSDKKWAADNMSQIFQTDNKRDPVLRVATVPYDRQENRKSVMSDITNRKPEWGNVSPNQRPNPVITQENRRSDYFEEHRRSPMPVIDQKRMDDLRRSPMPFISVRDSSCERVAQNSPSYPIPANQNFEKTRQELVIWAEQRQRHEVERTMHPNPIFATSPRSRNPSEERRVMIPLDEQRNKDIRVPQVAFQPIPNISQNTIMEQRRHLRHVSADLTKHMELSRKDFEDQPISGSVANLGPGVSTSSSQRASPNLCHQFPAMSEAKLDTKTLLTVVTDFPGDNPMKPLEQTDHIIHSHKKSHNISACLLTHSKSQVENLQSSSGLGDMPDKTECNHSQQQQQHQQQHQQQSLDMIAEKLSQFERQQSDLQARLQCLQNQNHLLDQVAHHQYQHQQSDLQSRLQCLQDRQATEKSLRQAIELQQKNAFNDMHHMQMKALADQVIDQQQHQPGEPLSKQMMDQHLLNRNSAYLSAGFTNQMCQSLTSERLSPRIQVETELERSQITLPTNSQFERNDGTRGSHQYRLMCQSADAPDNIVASCPSSASSCSSSNTINVTSGASATGVTFSGTLKKVPPEKPPRTSLIVQSPETESNRSQPAIGLKHTPKSRPTIFGTVASDLNPKDGNSRRALVYRDGNLVSGSLEALVQHMVPTEDYYPDRAYLFAFLLSARLFIKPHELLGEVCALCEHQQNLNGEGGKERLQRFVPRLVQLLAEWTETFPYDFRDERVMGHVRSITQKVAAVDAAARQEVSALLQNLLLRLTALERYEEGLSRLATEAATEQLTQVDVTELCPSATVLAQQLTHVELERLSYIGPEEFVQAFAKESPHLETSFKDMKKTRNLESYVQWFNRLSYFVATEVCKHAKKKQRVRVVEYWIETARECFNIGNFNSLMAIIAGLNMSPISRLKKTWSKVQSAKFSILEHQMDPSSNFSSYRSTLKAAMWRSVGATDERQRIVVPFFSLLVKDLYFLNEGCSNKLPNGHINFEKFWQLAKQVTEFIAWKQVACPFEKNSRVIAFLQASPVLTENALALASFECEPPDNNPEKERYKALKSDLNAQ
ncbi:uncharacterized protein LOC123274987 isoform X2 [Cotesia glomerata]|uniref:uncharacterized protein LOC123274987 isoform X2 n=1 Tax=Cotesia glomerata TaxID=32391 RepID=UPI001D008597|nr:uncharacterized protein LOC123274987 isoform X2 [Cotesia glomerata]